MKASKIFMYAVVLWTLVESRHAARLGRSLDVEGKGSNLTQKQQQEVIHADILQHFTSTPSDTSKSLMTSLDAIHDSTSSFIKDVPVIPEEINVQTLKDDTHLHVTYDRKISIDKENPNINSYAGKNKTEKTNTNDVISYSYNETGSSTSIQSEVLISHSAYDHSSTSVVYDEDDSNYEENYEAQTHEYRPSISSTTEVSKIGPERKSIDTKKKDKGKKEIPDSVTVPTDYNGAGRIEKPYKDNINSVKLKEKTKDSISEALDDRRSTTIRISSSSSSSSVSSVSEHDNNKPLSSLDILKPGSSSTNNEESVNQSVNSVINSNGVNSDSLKKPRVKYSVKRMQDVSNDTEVDNSSASGNLLNEDAAKNTVLGVNVEPQTTPSSVETASNIDVKLPNHKQHSSIQHAESTELTPIKIDSLGKLTTPSPTSIIKPSVAFKHQLVNKLKGQGADPAPTLPISSSESADANQDKFVNKPSTKSSLRKKSRPEYHSSSEMYILPTATAWTLVSLKSTPSSRKPISSDINSSTSSETLTTPAPKQTTITPASRVKGFVPWSTRLQKSSSIRPSTTPSIEISDIRATKNTASLIDSEVSSSTSNENIQSKYVPLKISEHSIPTLTTEENSVIRTTLELDRNITETSSNLIQSSLNDVMVKDQSTTLSQDSTKSIGSVTTEVLVSTSSIPKVEHTPDSKSGGDVESTAAENENIIETKQASEENDTHNKSEGISKGILEEKYPNNTKSTANEVISVHFSEKANEIKPGDINENISSVATTAVPTLEDVDHVKVKNKSEIGELDPAPSEILIDGGGDEEKSGEESDEDYKLKQTTTLEPFDTTVISDLDEDIEGDSDREDEELTVIVDKTTAKQTTIHQTNEFNETDIEVKSTTSLPTIDVRSTSTYVTSFDIVSKENTTQVVTKTPSEGDINWYNIDSKIEHASIDETSHKPTPVDTTTIAAIETTNEPESTTETSKQETTVLPETTEKVTTASPMAVTPVTDPTVSLEDGTSFESVEDPTSCVRIVVHVSPMKLCQEQQQLRESIASQIMTEQVSWEQVLIMNKKLQDCETKEQSTEDQRQEVDVCFIDRNQEPSPVIRDEFLKLHTKRINNPSFPIVEVQMIMQSATVHNGFDNVLAAIILSVIAAICLVLLGILLVIIRKRQGRFNYGQRCTPVSLDDYSLDNISVYNSVRRKGAFRASKRSYGNPGFDDPGGPSHPINFAGLANFSSDREALDEEFNQIPMITVKPDELPPGAESKNRYANVIPLPETRVPLQTKDVADPLSEYINANFVKGPKGLDKLYIACQAPLQSTVEDFWRMVWQQQTKVILMLTALNENGVEKCADYLPQLEITDCHRLFGDFQVTLKKHEVREKYIISSLQLKNLETNLWREVTHLWYLSWPSQGVPEDGSAMIAFLIEARSYMRGAQGPTVVHCSPGTGRTGTVIAIDLCIRDFETLRSVDIPKTVYALRRDRAGAVQTKDQYAFIYQVLNLYATKLTGGALDSI